MRLIGKIGKPGFEYPLTVPAELGSLYPYMLVNIKDGVTIYVIESATEFRRVCSQSIGGSTLWGLLRLTTNFSSLQDALTNAIKGDYLGVDMTVGDIYGNVFTDSIGLDPEIIASSCAKLRSEGEFSENDIARSLLTAIMFNITQMVCCTAASENVDRVIVCDSYINIPEFMIMC
jgi:pantothenate kinase